ncbi:MAG TPA: Uma2 family endonuclease [Tepidisphaeraceae bacterium]|jgi:Uma2 family endonuclease|nr:Uma2 family endonuclease [Tepidisphaeraceae bacterium]
MAFPQRVKRYTPEEYYRLERDAEFKSDYYDGEIFPIGKVLAMAGGTARHSLISGNLVREIGNRVKGGPCTVYESNLRLKILATGLRTYPDVNVYCEKLQRDEEDQDGETYTNPSVLFEVLSKSTEAYDRGFKADSYRQIKSLRAYGLVSQTTAHIELFERQPDGLWVLREAKGLEAVLSVPPLRIELPLAEAYDRVEFGPGDEPLSFPGEG